MFASEKVMLDYLSQLLNEDENANKEVGISTDVLNQQKKNVYMNPTSDYISNEVIATKPQLRPIVSAASKFNKYKELSEPLLAEPNSVEKLLQQVDEEQELQKNIKDDSISVDLVGTEVNVQNQTEVLVELQPKMDVEDEFPDKPFQALFFEVAGLVLAVPLKELGGIHNLTEVNSLIGKPKWFKGVMLNREKKLNVVDSALWVMPEKYDNTMKASIDYKYLITLGESDWGLTAEKLVETETIHPDAVKWRNGRGKRPWLLGTIKEKMCALLHVSDLIAMLEQGINAREK